MDNCTAIAAAASTDISSLIYDPDTPPTPIDTSVLPPNLNTKLQECDGDANCKLVMYDFNTNTGTKADSADYLIQLESNSRTANNSMVTVMSNVSTKDTTSLGIPTDNLDLHYDPNHLRSTPAIASGPIGFSSIDATILGTGSSDTASTIDGCAIACDSSSTCGGFNFGEDSSCTLFNIVDKDFTVTNRYGGSNGQRISTLSLTLNGSLTGVASGQTVSGLETYINGPITITSASVNIITISFDSQVVYQIPANTQITISAARQVDPNATVHGYTSNKSRINLIGVNGTMSYGYSGDFTVSQQLNSLPTNVLSANPSAVSSTSSVSRLELTFLSLPSPLPVISSATLSFDNSGVVMINDSTRCIPTSATVSDACKAVLSFNSVNGNTITFDLPSGGGFIRNVIDNSVRVYFTTTEFTLNVTTGTPSDRIMGWSGTLSLFPITVTAATSSSITASFPVVSGINPPVIGMTGTVGGYPITVTAVTSTEVTATITLPQGSTLPAINTTGTVGNFPVSVVGFTNSTITFSGPSIIPSIGVRAQTIITLSDNNGSTCQDIKACNASIQRLLDNPAIRSFSTLDLVACSACPERAYTKPTTSQTGPQFDKLREYLWYGNSGKFVCPTTLPTGASSFDENCTPVCTPSSDQNAISTEYDTTTSACKITCRTGYRWDGTNCVACPSVTLDSQTTYTYTTPGSCIATCTYIGALPASTQSVTTVNDANGTTTTSCTVACSTGYNRDSTSKTCTACPAVTTLAEGTRYTYNTSGLCVPTCSAILPQLASIQDVITTLAAGSYKCTTTCSIGYFSSSDNLRCCAPPTSEPVGTQFTAYTDATCQAVSCSIDTTYDSMYGSVSGGLNGLCSFACPSAPSLTNGTGYNYKSTSTSITSSAINSITAECEFPVGGTFSKVGRLDTDIGTYTFDPPKAFDAIGTTLSYSYTGPITIGFPFPIQLTRIVIYKGSGITGVSVSLYKQKSTTSDPVLSQSATFTSSPQTLSFSQIVFGKKLVLTFTGTGNIGFQIFGNAVKNCMVQCTPPSGSPTGSYAVYDDVYRTCSMSCPIGYAPITSGCQRCDPPATDPGTSYTGNAGVCSGTCTTSIANATVYGGAAVTNRNQLDTQTSTYSSSGTRECHIKSCPSGYTQFTTSTSVTPSKGGCCRIPTLKANSTSDATITDGAASNHGISWSFQAYNSNSPGTTTCAHTCSTTNTTINVTAEGSDTQTPYCVVTCKEAGKTFTEGGCSACSPPEIKPGTTYNFNTPGSCAATCSVATGQPSGTTVSTTPPCTISACPANHTKYTTTAETAISNGGCCPIPTTIRNSGQQSSTSLKDSGITWSFPAAGSSASVCIATFTAPSTNPWNLSIVSSSERQCPADSETRSTPSGFNFRIEANCQPVCSLTTSDANSTTSYVSSGNTKCTKTCKGGYSKGSGAASICCSTVTITTSLSSVVSPSYGSISCNDTTCSYTGIANVNIAGAYLNNNNNTCYLSCRAVVNEVGGTVSYNDGSGSAIDCDYTCTTSSVANSTTLKTNYFLKESEVDTNTASVASLDRQPILPPDPIYTLGFDINVQNGAYNGRTILVNTSMNPTSYPTTFGDGESIVRRPIIYLNGSEGTGWAQQNAICVEHWMDNNQQFGICTSAISLQNYNRILVVFDSSKRILVYINGNLNVTSQSSTLPKKWAPVTGDSNKDDWKFQRPPDTQTGYFKLKNVFFIPYAVSGTQVTDLNTNLFAGSFNNGRRCALKCNTGYIKKNLGWGDICVASYYPEPGTTVTYSAIGTICSLLDTSNQTYVIQQDDTNKICKKVCNTSGGYYIPSGYSGSCCKTPTVSGITWGAAPTPSDPCNFSCSVYSDDPYRVVEINQSARTCTVTDNCVSGYFRTTQGSPYPSTCEVLYKDTPYKLYNPGTNTVYSTTDPGPDFTPIIVNVGSNWKPDSLGALLGYKRCPSGTVVNMPSSGTLQKVSVDSDDWVTDPPSTLPSYTYPQIFHSDLRTSTYKSIRVGTSVNVSCRGYVYRKTDTDCPTNYARWTDGRCVYIPYYSTLSISCSIM